MDRVHEDKSTFVLLVEWERIGDHLEGFRRSNAYAQWRTLISPFFDGDPVVIHLSSLLSLAARGVAHGVKDRCQG
ncbi:MAG: hypothetical protein MP439_04180 [Ferrimicrobium sp.]|jgi:quinol monooxygenase YgiN|nr:hypothetical protein [Ferrimicrobium sp.]